MWLASEVSATEVRAPFGNLGNLIARSALQRTPGDIRRSPRLRSVIYCAPISPAHSLKLTVVHPDRAAPDGAPRHACDAVRRHRPTDPGLCGREDPRDTRDRHPLADLETGQTDGCGQQHDFEFFCRAHLASPV